MSNQQITLTTSDGIDITVERQAAECSILIKNLLGDLGFDSEGSIPPIQFPETANVNERVMHQVLKWCERHKNDDPADNDFSTDLHAWDQEFMQLDHGMLVEVIRASNYLDINALLDLSCKTAANRIKGKSPEEIKTMFNIEGHSTPTRHVSGSSVSPETSPLLPFTSTFHPTLLGALHVRQLLERILPPELAVPIASQGYSPWLVKRTAERRTYHANDFWREGPEASVAGLYLSTERIPHPDPSAGVGRVVPKRVVFQTRAADQGWATFGGHGTFDNSHTWFEASVLRPSPGKVADNGRSLALEDDDVLSRPWENALFAREALNERGWDFVETDDGNITWRVCNNVTARDDYRDYRVEWKRGGITEVEDERAVGRGEGFLDLLGPGCIVVLWARAEQQAWVHNVEAATVEVEFELP